MTLEPGEGALIPVESGFRIAEVSVVEAALPIEGSVEAVPGVWPTGASQGMLLVAARDEPVALEKGTPVGELRSGFVSSGTCECGTVETILEGDAEDRCGECGAVNSSLAEQFCQTGGRTGAYEATALQGCRSCSGSRRRSIWRSAALAFVVGLGALAGSSSMMAYQDGQCELDQWSYVSRWSCPRSLRVAGQSLSSGNVRLSMVLRWLVGSSGHVREMHGWPVDDS